MRVWLTIVGLALVLSNGRDSDGTPGPFASDQRITYPDGLHNENTEMIRLYGPRLHTDAAHVWLRTRLRAAGDTLA